MKNSYEGAIQSPKNPLFPPGANWIRIDSFYGCPYSWRWSVGVRTLVTAAVAAVAASGKLGESDYVEAQPAIAAAYTYEELRCANGEMSDKEWEAWTTQPDDTYMLGCAAQHLGLELEAA